MYYRRAQRQIQSTTETDKKSLSSVSPLVNTSKMKLVVALCLIVLIVAAEAVTEGEGYTHNPAEEDTGLAWLADPRQQRCVQAMIMSPSKSLSRLDAFCSHQ